MITTETALNSLYGLIQGKQDELIAGSGISIDKNVISVTGSGGGSGDGSLSTEEYNELKYRLDALTRRMASHASGLKNAIRKDNIYSAYVPLNDDDDAPSMDDYKKECHIWFSAKYAPTCAAEYRPPKTGGILETVRDSATGGQYFYPVSGGSSDRWQIWYRPLYYNSGYVWGEWQCINGVDDTKLKWVNKG